MHAVTRAAEGFGRRAFTVSEVLRRGRALPEALSMGFESALDPRDDGFVEAPLVVEVASSSLAYDCRFKAELYAKRAVQQYWVVDAVTRTTYQFTGPHGESWRRRIERGPDDVLTHAELPGFSIRLSDT